MSQAHLCPLPISAQPVYWQYDHALRLAPLPDALIIAEDQPVSKTKTLFISSTNLLGVCQAQLRLLGFLRSGVLLPVVSPCACVQAYSKSWFDCLAFNPGSFTAEKTFIMYMPVKGKAEVSAVNAEDDGDS
jgi:hypothetical protein